MEACNMDMTRLYGPRPKLLKIGTGYCRRCTVLFFSQENMQNCCRQQEKRRAHPTELNSRDLLQLRRGYRMWVIYGSATHDSWTHIPPTPTICMFQIPVSDPTVSSDEATYSNLSLRPLVRLSLAPLSPSHAHAGTNVCRLRSHGQRVQQRVDAA